MTTSNGNCVARSARVVMPEESEHSSLAQRFPANAHHSSQAECPSQFPALVFSVLPVCQVLHLLSSLSKSCTYAAIACAIEGVAPVSRVFPLLRAFGPGQLRRS